MISALNQHIETTPGVRGGKPRIAGRRITVADIAILYLRMGQPLETVAQEYELSLAAVHTAMAYYYDHQVEIAQSITDSEAFAEEFRQNHPSPLQKKLA
ncbi:MAG: DUF433 domain-containing protein [Timaviella obliquedivisa GSE-PSE-MK23-08B]|jgi:uncharacterized protein (DUF433 family)|nr:DUF433 domain-containing protein [Timaviella obliquedivisa GSE-PSE-MK23-08B]